MVERSETLPLIDQVEQWIQLGWGVSRQALLYTYPQLEDFKDLLITRIHLGNSQRIMMLERNHRPRASFYLYDEYCKMGVPEKVLDQYYYQTKPNSPFYPDYRNGHIWLAESFLSRFKSGDKIEWLNATGSLGDILIEQNLKLLALKLHPYDFEDTDEFFLRLMMKQDMKLFLDELANQLKGKDQRRAFRAASREWVSNLFSPAGFERRQARFEAAGVKVFCLFANQSVLEAELMIGDDFDSGTIEYLSQPVKELFRQLLVDALEIKLTFHPFIASRQQQQAEQIFAISDLDRDAVLRKYTHSTLAKYYLQSDDQRLDPFNYGQVAN